MCYNLSDTEIWRRIKINSCLFWCVFLFLKGLNTMLKSFVEFDMILIMRMLLAATCGAFLGYERKHRGKSAGIRTHLVVAAASALMIMVSKYGFNDMANAAINYRVDPSRIAAGIVSGVGFLGAGMIFIRSETPQGLTTAAGIWATSGIGMAIGAGMYTIGIAATVFIYIAQYILHKVPKIYNEDKNTDKNADKNDDKNAEGNDENV